MTDLLPDDEIVDDLSFLDDLIDERTANTEDIAETQSLAMFEGDTSQLYPEQRRCLHALLKNRYLSAERHPDHWATLTRDEALIRSRLNELFFELRIERGVQIAFKQQAKTDSGERLPTLLNEVAHSKEETIVMIHLRQRFLIQRQEGDDIVFIDRQTLLDEVADQRPENSTHRAMDQRRANKAIDGLATAGLLLKTPDPDRFRISPIIEALMPVEKLRSLWTWLMTRNAVDATQGLGADTTDDDDLLATTEEDDE